MRFLEEYSDAGPGALISEEIKRIVRHPGTLMEVCGGQTHTIMKSGLEDLLPPELTLMHGPGCPVCVTPIEMIDKAVEIAGRPDSILCSFGDMLRVPGSRRSLLDAKTEGADVRIVYSPLDAARLTQSNSGKLLEGIRLTVTQLEEGRATLENQHARAVRPEGNPAAKNLIAEVFEIVPREWRGIGEIPGSGLRLRGQYRAFDANLQFPSKRTPSTDSGLCISGLILQGLRKPYESEAFRNPCTPETPLGAPMVSSEGACAAYYRYGHRQ